MRRTVTRAQAQSFDRVAADYHRFFNRAELERSCKQLLPGYRFDSLGGVRGIGLIWDAPRGSATGGT